MLNLYLALRSRIKQEEGQGMVEYSMIIGLIAVGLVAGLGLMGDGLDGLFNRITTTLSTFVP